MGRNGRHGGAVIRKPSCPPLLERSLEKLHAPPSEFYFHRCIGHCNVREEVFQRVPPWPPRPPPLPYCGNTSALCRHSRWHMYSHDTARRRPPPPSTNRGHTVCRSNRHNSAACQPASRGVHWLSPHRSPDPVGTSLNIVYLTERNTIEVDHVAADMRQRGLLAEEITSTRHTMLQWDGLYCQTSVLIDHSTSLCVHRRKTTSKQSLSQNVVISISSTGPSSFGP